MSRAIGFSTGSLAGAGYTAALQMLRETSASAVELSALREHEFEPLLRDLRSLDLDQFRHVALHVPSALSEYTEAELIRLIGSAGISTAVVHPDIIQEPPLWRGLGSRLCIENMDKRKSTGRTSRELRQLFADLPDATFCLDIAHARQVDPTLGETVNLLQGFGHRLAQLHISELSTLSRHGPLTYSGFAGLASISDLIPTHVPAILEYAVTPEELEVHLQRVTEVLDHRASPQLRSVG